ncbi:MAG: hypothetical protein V4735_02770 [Pseudomonadota bacterium]
MRWLWRSLAFWAVSLPLFYLFGLPMLLDQLSAKATREGYGQCITQMRAEGLLGGANSPFPPERIDQYCHCVSDGLIFTKPDLFDMVQKRPPAALTALASAKAATCNASLEQSVGMGAATVGAPITPPATDDKVTHF